MKNKTPTITFDKTATEFILNALGYTKDKKGYIIDAKTKSRVRTFSNEEIKMSEFGGIGKGKDGKMLIFKNDIFDMIHLVELQEEGKFPKKMKDAKEILRDAIKAKMKKDEVIK